MDLRNYSSSIKSFGSIQGQYELALDNLDQLSRKNISLIISGLPLWAIGPYDAYCTLNSAREIESDLRREIERLYVLEITAAFEAKVVYYFRYHVKRRSHAHRTYRSAVSPRVYQEIKPLMFGDILKVFKLLVFPQDSVAYTDACNLCEYRNWLAHGRGWSLRENIRQRFDFGYTYTVIDAVMSALPSFPHHLKQ